MFDVEISGQILNNSSTNQERNKVWVKSLIFFFVFVVDDEAHCGFGRKWSG